MSKKILTAISKWGVVIFTTAATVVAIQVFADADRASDSGLEFKPVAPWSPAAGFADLIERVSPAVVHVAVSGVPRSRQQAFPEFNFPPGSPFEDFFEQFRDRQPEQEESRPLGIGSGFIISADGYVVTNYHVISEANEIVVTLSEGKEYDAELIGSDDKTDLALLKLKDADNLAYVEFGDDQVSRVGDWVVAIGNPFGLGGSASTGIISARGRDIRSGPYDDYIQVDAAINRGNSGGPLFNLNGEVIGINTAIYSPNGGSVGIGFSIPASLAENVITQLRDSGGVARAYIGVELQLLSDKLAEGFGRDNDEGALISSVQPGLPAAKAGIQEGDIILSFNGSKVEKMRDLPRIVAESPVGEKIELKVWREGKLKSLTITPEPYPDNDELADIRRGGSAESQSDNEIGASLAAISDEYRNRYDIDENVQGVLVVSVQRDGLAAKNGLRRGDVISSVNNSRVRTPSEVREAIVAARTDEKKMVMMRIQRANGSRFLPFELNE